MTWDVCKRCVSLMPRRSAAATLLHALRSASREILPFSPTSQPMMIAWTTVGAIPPSISI